MPIKRRPADQSGGLSFTGGHEKMECEHMTNNTEKIMDEVSSCFYELVNEYGPDELQEALKQFILWGAELRGTQDGGDHITTEAAEDAAERITGNCISYNGYKNGYVGHVETAEDFRAAVEEIILNSLPGGDYSS